VVWDNIPFLLTDTVGFIRKLPTHLIESFKSTLDEIREADVLVHVVDVAHPAHDQQIEVVNQVLADLKCAEKPCLLIFNKADLLPQGDGREEIESGRDAIFISAGKGSNVPALRQAMLREIRTAHRKIFPNWLEKEVYMGESAEI
jgi:GTP-binding protein HflX